MNPTLEQLKKDLTALWENGRQVCGAVSLTGHTCAYPFHTLPPSGTEMEPIGFSLKTLPIKDESKRTSKSSNENVDTDEDEVSIRLMSRRTTFEEEEKKRKEDELVIANEEMKKAQTVTITPHCSKVQLLLSCMCGKTRRFIHDPFNIFV